ncbi:uncharacterized protein LOC129727875 isoform X2 [Wyeomyia smithii]|nr:uncharacterized protein LOC129727875 isoform X2 [Wyeomyia smithii]
MAPKVKSETANVQASTGASRSNAETSRTMDTASGGVAIQTDGIRHRGVATGNSTSSTTSDRATTFPANHISTATADYIMGQQLAMQNWMQQTYMQYLNQYMNAISTAHNEQQARHPDSHHLPVPTVPQLNPQQIPTMPITAANANPILAQTTPNLSYYPYLSTLNSSQLPSASSIPAPITSSGTILNNQPHPTNISTAVPASSSNAASVMLPKGPSSSVVPQAEATAGPSRGVTASTTPTMPPGTTTSDGATDAAVDTADAGNAAPGTAADAPAAPAPARRFPNIVVEEQENRDWLDIFFSMCRVGILMTVVYMYSSPIRCMTVFVIGTSLYLYQIGFFRNNNADRLERARRIVVQQLNNAHGIRPNAVARARLATPAPAPEADANGATDDNPQVENNTTSENPKDGADSPKAEQDMTTESTTATESDKKSTSPTPEPLEEDTMASTEPGTLEVDDLTSTVMPEANRVNLNDVAAFLRTLVLSFFTSIIPDTPAA